MLDAVIHGTEGTRKEISNCPGELDDHFTTDE
jgi:hypothetical protein